MFLVSLLSSRLRGFFIGVDLYKQKDNTVRTSRDDVVCAWLVSTKAEIVVDREIITDCCPRGSGMLGWISSLNLLPL
jgi:hypothetical protein